MVIVTNPYWLTRYTMIVLHSPDFKTFALCATVHRSTGAAKWRFWWCVLSRTRSIQITLSTWISLDLIRRGKMPLSMEIVKRATVHVSQVGQRLVSETFSHAFSHFTLHQHHSRRWIFTNVLVLQFHGLFCSSAMRIMTFKRLLRTLLCTTD